LNLLHHHYWHQRSPVRFRLDFTRAGYQTQTHLHSNTFRSETPVSNPTSIEDVLQCTVQWFPEQAKADEARNECCTVVDFDRLYTRDICIVTDQDRRDHCSLDQLLKSFGWRLGRSAHGTDVLMYCTYLASSTFRGFLACPARQAEILYSTVQAVGRIGFSTGTGGSKASFRPVKTFCNVGERPRDAGRCSLVSKPHCG